MINTARKILRTLSIFERWSCILAFAILASVLFLDVLSRTLLGNGLNWSHQVGVYANIVVALLGIGLASAAGSHLRPRFADNILPRSFDKVMQHLEPLVTALVLFIFALLASFLVLESYQLQERSTVLHSLLWPVQLLLPLAFYLAVARFLIYARYPGLKPAPQAQAE
jgi:TRAP-type C4-dicarboxylate transport system permease small subunit